MDTYNKAMSESQITNPLSKDGSLINFQNLISQAPVPITIFKGPNFIVESINNKALEIWDKTHDKVIGKPLCELSPETEGGLLQIFNKIYSTGEPFTVTEYMVLLMRKGKLDTAYFNILNQPLRDINNTIYGIISIGTEITEAVHARKQIEVSEKRFSNILAQSLIAIAILKGPQMIVTSANQAIIAIWGKGNDVIGKSLLEILPEIKDQVFPSLLLNVYETGEHFVTNEIKCILHRNEKQEECYFNLVYQPYRDVDDSITGITILATEITQYVLAKKQIEENEEEQKKLAKHFKLATDSARVGIWSLDIASLTLEWSTMHKKMWGYDDQKENLTYSDWHSVIVPEDIELAFQKIEESKINHNVYEVDYRIARANDGEIVWIKSTGHYHYDEFGQAHTLTGVSIDISKQKKIDEELSQAIIKAKNATATAEHAVIAKQQFLSNMSHEIRTPMNAIIGFTNVLLKTDLSEKQTECLKAIQSSGDTLIVLINDILDLAKVDAGKMIFVNEPFKVSELLSSVIRLFETKVQESNLQLITEYDDRIPEIILGDSVRLHQILINLLSNAIKFTSEGNITINVNVKSATKQKITIEFKVSDTGIGIPANKIETIFENFEQAHVISSNLYGGTGLGLAIVKQLVEKQGGTITVDSKVDEGTTFSCILNFQKNTVDAMSNFESEKINHDTAKIKKIKVLVVEDVKLNQLLLRTILDDYNFEWEIADNGQIAIEKLETNTYDIILMDLQMPIMNGFEATKYIRNTMNLQIPIIALTADVTTVDVEKCKSIGMNDYISKPLDEKLLYTKILDVLNIKDNKL
ncbi:ATP-binding protein [Flavobacterium sp. XS2P14]|uniref:PAS domain-containing hybrid sensor histidine kinase/response regulator n=1 Tax=Flavobacterium sp. XS2P14 TaxID=3401735 RepID=UPI003AAA6947